MPDFRRLYTKLTNLEIYKIKVLIVKYFNLVSRNHDLLSKGITLQAGAAVKRSRREAPLLP
ncbi:hypothetical protein C0039_14965 [Pseudohalioglobus lutimaris]|uniref:Uncharacterized protein n=1 Tax=Pseudohalioglobus lutimaris TaxID=1737061 RepID=A0A2N5X0A3_9GAMM|nr:hypothetical protein C0039_14965 [Pseudohalioglobus lutimaris]